MLATTEEEPYDAGFGGNLGRKDTKSTKPQKLKIDKLDQNLKFLCIKRYYREASEHGVDLPQEIRRFPLCSILPEYLCKENTLALWDYPQLHIS